MAERQVSFTPTSGPYANQTISGTLNDGNPFTQQSTSMVLANQSTTTAMIPVTLPSGRVVQMTAADAQVLQAEYQQLQQQQAGVRIGGGGGEAGLLTTGAEAALTISEFFNGREGKRLLKKTATARKDLAAAEKAVLKAIDDNDPKAQRGSLAEYFEANRRVNDLQDDIASAMANQAYWRAAGSGVKTYDRLRGAGGGIFGSGSSDGTTGLIGGLAGGFVISELFREDDDE